MILKKSAILGGNHPTATGAEKSKTKQPDDRPRNKPYPTFMSRPSSHIRAK